MNFTDWTTHFAQNQNQFAHVDFDNDIPLTEVERKTITSAIQQFQRGENSEGKHLHAFAKTFDAEYFEAIKLFIREEQSHAIILGKFMKQQNIPLIRGHWIDGVFRWLRNICGLECSLIVLSSAEVVATTFYQALRESTSSTVLNVVCNQILRDEEMHINFQAFTLWHINKNRTWFHKKVIRYIHTTLMLGTLAVVWWEYGSVYRKGGFSFFRFVRETMTEFNRMDGMVTSEVNITCIRA